MFPQTGKEKQKILFIYLEPASFITDDIRNLKSRYEVGTYQFGGKSVSGIFSLLVKWFRQFIWLVRELPASDMVVGWFVDYHMLLPIFMCRLFGKPNFICEGGFGCLNIPEFRHGVFFSWWRKYIARYVVSSIECLIPVSGRLIESENGYTVWPEKRKFGLKNEIPNITTSYRIIPTGYEPYEWPMGEANRARKVCTVGFINSIKRFKIKGIDIVIEVSRLIPDTEFVIVGIEKEFQKVIENNYMPPSNFVMYAPMSRHELKEIYMNSSVYMQLSRVEGLPNVMCESMLCGCIPVGSPVFGIPDIIGDAGYVVDFPIPEHIAEIMNKALTDGPQLRVKARERIKNKFSATKRYQMLTKVIADLSYLSSSNSKKQKVLNHPVRVKSDPDKQIIKV